MQAPPTPENELARLEALRRYQILDSPAEPAFDDLTALASYICGAPISLVSLVDADRQWLKSRVGLDVQETSRDVSFCAHTILTDELMIVEDAHTDERFADNPLVAGAPNIRFYAGAPLMSADGHALGSLCVIDRVPRTLTESQRLALRALARLVVAQMEHRVKVFETVELLAERRYMEELEVAKQAAEGASRAKSEFLANISHELHTPLNGILGSAELLCDDAWSTDQASHLAAIVSSARRLLALVTDLLDFAEIERSPGSARVAPYAVRPLFADALRALEQRAGEKGLAFDVAIHPDVPDTLMGDSARVRQVLIHLVDNAVKFTAVGRVRVALGVEMSLRDDLLLHCAVTDTGVGLSADHQRIIFDPFTQADGSATRQFGGVGLGLTIAAHLVGKLGGRVWLDSELGTGSKFHFTFKQAVVDLVL